MGIGTLLRDERNIINPLRVPLVQQDNGGTARLIYFDSNDDPADGRMPSEGAMASICPCPAMPQVHGGQT